MSDREQRDMLREAHMLQEIQKQKVKREALRLCVADLAANHSIADLITDLSDSVMDRHVECGFEHRKHFVTISAVLRKAAALAVKYGL